MNITSIPIQLENPLHKGAIDLLENNIWPTDINFSTHNKQHLQHHQHSPRSAPEEVEGHVLRRVDAAPGAEHRAPAAALRRVAARRVLWRRATATPRQRRRCGRGKSAKTLENDDLVDFVNGVF